MLAPQSKYAIRALMFLAAQDSNEFMKVSEIAEQTNLPGPYLSKVLNTLAEDGLLVSRRGKNGGVKLAEGIDKISLYKICELLEDPLVRDECVLFKAPCNRKEPCPFHYEFSETKQKLLNYLKNAALVNS